MFVVQLIALFLVLVAIRLLLPEKNKFISLLLSFFLAVIFTVQLSSVLLTGEIADYRFYENFNLGDVLSVADFFGKESILLALVLAITTFLNYRFGKFSKDLLHRKTILLTTVLVGILLMSFNGGILDNAYGNFFN